MNQDIISILTRPLEHEWSVQGLGFMRTYLSETERLHLWHSSLKIHGATELHDHPWNFTSTVILGCVNQSRYEHNDSGSIWMKQRILCGVGGGPVGESLKSPEQVSLFSPALESFYTGATYTQKADEIHKSFPLNDTVTVVTREFMEDADHANVYYRVGGEFVSAHPRPASRAEVLFITRSVLNTYQETAQDMLDPVQKYWYTPNIFGDD